MLYLCLQLLVNVHTYFTFPTGYLKISTPAETDHTEACLLRWTLQKRGQEQLPLAQGQGVRQRVPGCVSTGAVKRSYPTSEVRGSSQECQAATAQERQRRATQVRGQGRQPGGPTPRPRPGAAAGRTNPTSKERWLRRRRKA